MDKDERIAELERQLKVAQYDAHFLQNRLEAIRATKERLIHLLETPTLQERFDAATSDEDVMDVIMGKG